MSVSVDGQPAPSGSAVGADGTEAVTVQAAVETKLPERVWQKISELDNERQKAVNALLAAGSE